MHQTKKTFVKSTMKMADLVLENPYLLLMMEHFEMNIVVRNNTVEQICNDIPINQYVFIAIANLYNGFTINNIGSLDSFDVGLIISFLKNSHRYYLGEKIPEIRTYIRDLYTKNDIFEISLVEKFFDEYSQEVEEHLNYEDVIAFPYFNYLACGSNNYYLNNTKYSAKEYSEHHTDIESKLGELKNLLLKHIPLKLDGSLRRRLLISLFELEYDLTIHSVIEESMLIPLIKKIEKQKEIG